MRGTKSHLDIQQQNFSGHPHATLTKMRSVSQLNPSLLVNQSATCQQYPLHLQEFGWYFRPLLRVYMGILRIEAQRIWRLNSSCQKPRDKCSCYSLEDRHLLYSVNVLLYLCSGRPGRGSHFYKYSASIQEKSFWVVFVTFAFNGAVENVLHLVCRCVSQALWKMSKIRVLLNGCP